MLEFLEMSCPSLLILVSTFTSLRLCRWYGLNFNTKQPLQLLFGEPGMTSCFCTSKESKHISVCYFKKKKKEGYFFPLPRTPTRVVKQPGKKDVDRVTWVKMWEWKFPVSISVFIQPLYIANSTGSTCLHLFGFSEYRVLRLCGC